MWLQFLRVNASPQGGDVKGEGATVPWNSSFAKKAKSFTQTGDLKDLRVLLPLLELPGFSYKRSDAQAGVIGTCRKALIGVWSRLLSNIRDPAGAHPINVSFRGIAAIMRRWEFDLCHQTVDESNNVQSGTPEFEDLVTYRKLLYDTQDYVVTRLANLEEQDNFYATQFCTQVLAINYFRLPVLAGILLNAMCRVDDENMDDHLVDIFTEFDRVANLDKVKSRVGTTVLDKSHSSLLSWVTLPIEDRDNFVDKLMSQDWLRGQIQTPELFCRFLKNVVSHVTQVVGDPKSVRWHLIPGYWLMMRQFLKNLMEMQPKEWGWGLMDCSAVLLANSDLLSVFIYAAFRRTHAVDTAEVLNTLGHIQTWLTALKQQKLGVPVSFNHDFFITGIRRIVDLEHSQILCRILNIFYEFTELFSAQARLDLLVDVVFKPHFFDFFLHWDPQVRQVFHYLVTFKCISWNEGTDKPEDPIDMVLQSKKNTFLKLIREQGDDPQAGYFDARLQVYVSRALDEYEVVTEGFEQWLSDSKIAREKGKAVAYPEVPPLGVTRNNRSSSTTTRPSL